MEQLQSYSGDKPSNKLEKYSIPQLGVSLQDCKAMTSLPTISFLNKTYEVAKIRDIKDLQQFQPAFVLMFAEVIALSGVKSEVQSRDKADIMKMILTAFNGLSLHEIYKAFELERFGQYEAKTPTYDRFNADYVSTILGNYKNWKRKEMTLHLITAPSTEPTPEPYSDKAEAFKYFEVYKKTGTLEGCFNITCVYQFLYEEKVLPRHDRDFIEKYRMMAKMTEIYSYKKETFGEMSDLIQARLNEINENNALDETKRTARRLIMQDYFKDLINRKVPLETEI